MTWQENYQIWGQIALICHTKLARRYEEVGSDESIAERRILPTTFIRNGWYAWPFGCWNQPYEHLYGSPSN